MSVLIKDMQMPKNCRECPFLYDGDACYAANKPNAMFLPLVCNGRTDEYPINEFPFHEKRVDWCPLMDAEPVRHGKWIEGKCNRCGEHAPYWSMASTYYRSNFCPNCGARMDAE